MRSGPLSVMAIFAIISFPPMAFGQSQEKPPRPDCNALASGYASVGQSLNKSHTYRGLVSSFKSATDEGKAKMKAYRALRKQGKMEEAKAAAEELDRLWARSASLVGKMQMEVTKGQSGASRWCQAYYAMTSQGCTSAKAQRTCDAHTTYWNNAANYVASISKFSDSWRTAADYNFDPPKSKTVKCVADLDLKNLEAGSVQEFSGRGRVVRGLGAVPLTTGMTLHPGDIVALDDGAKATITVYGHQYRLLEKNKFEVPAPPVARQPQQDSVAGTVGKNIKGLLQGESTELRGPCGGAGVRG